MNNAKIDTKTFSSTYMKKLQCKLESVTNKQLTTRNKTYDTMSPKLFTLTLQDNFETIELGERDECRWNIPDTLRFWSEIAENSFRKSWAD